MTIPNIPSGAFVIEGDPEAIAESGRAYGRSAALAAEAAGGLGGIDSGSWTGTSGDQFRARLAALPPRLDVTERAFAQVAQALTAFADTLADARQHLRAVGDEAEQTSRLLTAARAEGDPPSRVTALEATLEEQLTAASTIRARVQEAARDAVNRIRAAERL